MATSSPSTKGFGTGTKGDKAGKSKKARPVDFAASAAPNVSPIVPAASSPVSAAGPAKARRGDEPNGARPAEAPAHAGRGADREDAIHALTSAGAPLVTSSMVPPAHAPHGRNGTPATDRRDERASFAADSASAARGSQSDATGEVQRPGDSARAATPASDTRPAHQPAPAADKAPSPAPSPGHAQPAPASPPAQGVAAPVPQVPLAAQPLYDLAGADQSLQATALGKNAHLHLEAGAAGPVSLHLTVRDGVADLEVEGPGADRLDMRPEELRRALAGEGLELGRFASRVTDASETRTQQDPARDQGGQNQGSGERASQPDQAPRPSAMPFTTQSGASSFGGEGRRHWQGEAPYSADRDRRPGAAAPNGAPSSSPSDTPPTRRRGVHVTA